jgi:hypothetical protein
MKRNIRIIVMGALVINALIGCSKQNEIPDSTTKLLHAIVESPNEELYHAQPTEIGIGTDVPDEGEIDATQKAVEEEKNAWDKAVGDCFSEGMFDTFWNSQGRIYFLGASAANGFQTGVKEIELVETNDNIQHIKVTVQAVPSDYKEAETKDFETEWRVIYDKDNPELIQTIELTDDDGFWEWNVKN